jgi:hypothetical protein
MVHRQSRFARALAPLGTALAWLIVGGAARAADAGPTVAKDSVIVNAFTLNVFKNDYDKWSWVPKIAFRVNGPIPSGSQLYVEFALPGGGAVKFDCPTEETAQGRWFRPVCGARDVPPEKATTATGKATFKIKMRNELANSDELLFSGKATVGKVHSSEHGPKAANKWVYYVDDDFNLPIAYVYLIPGEPDGWDYPTFQAAFWVRGEPTNIQPHLFLGDREVGKMVFNGQQVGQAGCEAELTSETSQFVDESVPQKAKWARIKCDFPSVKGWDKKDRPPGMFGPVFLLSKNPGDYELKVLINNHLARSLKFTVGADGKFDNGIAAANNLGSNRTILPVKIIGDQDGKWNKDAWKTDAFYGNPLTGFAAAK